MKMILVVDIDDDLCEDYEDFYVDYDLRATNKEDDFVESIRYVEDCKLKPIPKKKIHIPELNIWKITEEDKEIMIENRGYNKYIDDSIRRISMWCPICDKVELERHLLKRVYEEIEELFKEILVEE